MTSRPAILILALLIGLGSLRESHAIECVFDQTRKMFFSEDAALDDAIQSGNVGRLLDPAMQRYNAARMKFDVVSQMGGRADDSVRKMADDLMRTMIRENNEMMQVLSSAYSKVNVSHQIRELPVTIQKQGFQYIEIDLKNLPKNSDSFRRLARVNERLDPRNFPGEKTPGWQFWKKKKNDFPHTLEVSAAITKHGQAATWSEGGWRTALVPSGENLEVFFPRSAALKGNIYHEFAHGFFSKRRLLGKPSSIYDVHFRPKNGVRANIYSYTMSGEEVYNGINTPYWAWRDIDPSKLTSENFIAVHNDIINGKSGLNGAKENVDLLLNSAGRIRGVSKSALGKNLGGQQLEFLDSSGNHVSYYIDEAAAKAAVQGQGPSGKMADPEWFESRLRGIRMIAEQALEESPAIQKKIIELQADFVAKRLSAEEAHAQVLALLRAYGMPSRKAIYAVPVPAP